MPTIIIDGKEIECKPGQTIIQAAKDAGIDIPHFCWHPSLSVSGNCRVCLVEIEKIISEARNLDAQGKLEADRNRKELARQGDLLLQRVASARELYAGLKRVAEAERGLRGLAAH